MRSVFIFLSFIILSITSLNGCATPSLIKAAYYGDVNTITKLIEEGQDVNLQGGSWHETALSAASRQGHMESVKILLDSGANPNISTKYGGNALTGATWKCHSDIARLLVRKGAEINQRNFSHGSTPLMLAVECNDESLVRFLLDHGAKTDIKNRANNDALMAATMKGFSRMAQILIDYGADVNSKGCGNQTAIYQAAEKNSVETLKILIENGANVNHQIYASCKDGYFNSVPIPGWTALMIASAEGYTEAVKILLGSGADPNMAAQNGRTALMVAAGEGNIEIVKLLLDNHADTAIKDKEGRTAIDLAIIMKHKEIVSLLENR